MPWLSKCIGSVLQSTVPADIMVIDNTSTDDTEATVRRDYPQVMFLENYANLGFGQANNIGMNYALRHGYRAVLLLNQDAWIDPDVIGQMRIERIGKLFTGNGGFRAEIAAVHQRVHA